MRALCLSLLLTVACVSVSATVPNMMSYQGRLTDDTGVALTGDYNITFVIYADSIGSTTIWTEAHYNIPVTDGLFSAVLGSITPLDESVFDGSVRYFAMSVSGGPYGPAVPLLSVGNAIRSAYSDTAAYALNSAGGSKWVLSDSVLYTEGYYALARGDADNQVVGDFRNSHVNLGVSCTTGTEGEWQGWVTVSGGVLNIAQESGATIGGGYGNQSKGGYSSIGGGVENTADSGWSTIGGGYFNRTSGSYGTIGGGNNNLVNGLHGTVGGGSQNEANGMGATVPGGLDCIAEGASSLAAGTDAQALHDGCFVWADHTLANPGPGWEEFPSTETNQFLVRASSGVGINTNAPEEALHVDGTIYSSTGGFKFPDGSVQTTAGSGWTLVDSVLYTSGFYAIARGDANSATLGTHRHTHVNLGEKCTTGVALDDNKYATISGGAYNLATGRESTVGGGTGNHAIGRISTIGGGLSNVADSGLGTIGGGSYNFVQGFSGTVSGGRQNVVREGYATIGGGVQNEANGEYSTVGGGHFNVSRGPHSVVSGGLSNSADSSWSVVGGGIGNQVIGQASVIPGGYDCHIEADGCFAAGSDAQALHDGSFVWADRSAEDTYGWVPFQTTDSNQFLVQAAGGFGINTNTPLAALDIANVDNNDPAIHFKGTNRDITWNPAHSLQFGQWDGSSYTQRMMISSDGNVGIGTGYPDELLHVKNGNNAGNAFFKVHTSHASNWGECGIRIETPQNRWHFRMDDDTNNNLPDGALGLRSQNNGYELMTWTQTGNVGIRMTSPSYELDVDGDIRCISLTETSDGRLKRNVADIEDALKKVSLVRGVTFDWADEVHAEAGSQMGVIAQEIESVMPELVSTDNDGIKSVDYSKLSAVLIEAVKELKAQNEELLQRIEQLESRN